MIRRARVALSLVLAALAGFWLGVAAVAGGAYRPRPAPRPDGRLRAWEACPDCDHGGRVHDPDLGCLGVVESVPDWPYRVAACPCTRRGCACPGLDATPPPGPSR